MAQYTTSVTSLPVNYYGNQYQMSDNWGVVDYTTTTLSDNSIRVNVTKLTVYFNCRITNPNIKPLYCLSCCGTWGLWYTGDFGTAAMNTWNFGLYFPTGNFTYTKNVNLSYTVRPGGSITIPLYRFGNQGDCGITTKSMSFRNNNPERSNTPPTVTATCSAQATTASASFGGSYGYCNYQVNSISWTLKQGSSTIKSGSGDNPSFSGLSPNTEYTVTATRSNGCYTATASCSFVTCVPNALSNPLATAWNEGQVRLSVTNGGAKYAPSTKIQYKKCNDSTWKDGPTSNTTTVDTIKLIDLEDDTCYQVRAITSTTACQYTSNTVSFTTPKKCVQAFIASQDVQMNDLTYATTNDVVVNYTAFSSPFDLWLEYRVKDGYIDTWEKTEVQTVAGQIGSSGLVGNAKFKLINLFPNLVEYEVKVIAEAKQDDCYFESSITTFTTPVIPEPDFTETCDTLIYLSELVCQAVKKLYDGNITILANPTTVAQCDPYNDYPTHLTLWSRLLRFFHAMNCLLCTMDASALKSGKEKQYYTGEIGWTDMLEEVVSDESSESWRLVTSGAVRAYIDAKLHEVWHSHGSVDYMVSTTTDRGKLPDDAQSCIVVDNDTVYEKKNGQWVKADQQPDDFAVYHINYAYGSVKAESAWYFFAGTWNNLDAEVLDLEERVNELEEHSSDLIQAVEGQSTEYKIVDEDFDFTKAEEGVVYLVTEKESKDLPYRTVTFDMNGEGDNDVRSQQVPDGAYAQEPTTPTDDNCTFEGWEEDKFVLTLTCLTPGTATFRNMWNSTILIDGEEVAPSTVNTGVTKEVKVGQRIKYSPSDTYPNAFRSWRGSFSATNNRGFGVVSSEDGATFELNVPDLTPFLNADGSAPGYFFANFCGGYYYTSTDFRTAAITRITDGSFDTSKITKFGSSFFGGFNFYGVLEELPAGSFDFSNIVSCDSSFLALFNRHGKLASLPEGSFNMSNIETVGSYFLYEFNYGGELVSLPEGSFDISKVTTYGQRSFMSFNQSGKLTSLPEGSFDFSNVTDPGDYFCTYFNSSGELASLPEGSFNISKITNGRYDFFAHFNHNGKLTHLPEGSFDTSNITVCGAYAFEYFNHQGELVDLPDGSFDLSNVESYGTNSLAHFNDGGKLTMVTPNLLRFSDKLTTAPGAFCSYFNNGGAIKEFPEGSLDTSHFETVGSSFFSNFCSGSKCATTELPKGSFNISNITSYGSLFFGYFNQNGNLKSLPDGSFNTSHFTELKEYVFVSFNEYGALESLPEGSFNFDNLQTATGSGCLGNFNRHSNTYPNKLSSLPQGSFNFDNLESVGNSFAYYFFAGLDREANDDNVAVNLPDGAFSFKNLKATNDGFCADFNYYGTQINFGKGAFNISNLETAGGRFMATSFYGSRTSTLPEGSFNTSKIKTAGNSLMMAMFESNKYLTKLPKGSFNFGSLEKAGNYAFYGFTWGSVLSSFPVGSFSFPKLTAENVDPSNYFSYFAWGNYGLTEGNKGVSFTALHDIRTFGGTGYPSPIPAGTTVYLNADED